MPELMLTAVIAWLVAFVSSRAVCLTTEKKVRALSLQDKWGLLSELSCLMVKGGSPA
jgi:hypothetical protein